MMPPRRPARRTNQHLVANRAKNVMLVTVKWQQQPVTLEQIRKQVLEKVHEKLSR